MLIFIHKNGQHEIVGRWLFDLGPWHIIRQGWMGHSMVETKQVEYEVLGVTAPRQEHVLQCDSTAFLSRWL